MAKKSVTKNRDPQLSFFAYPVWFTLSHLIFCIQSLSHGREIMTILGFLCVVFFAFSKDRKNQLLSRS